MEGGAYEMQSEDDKVPEKNAKRVVKTRMQVEALENLYNEEKNPSMATKKELADSIGLSEKQVNGWFCHRRLKDKRLLNDEIRSTGKQDRSSVVIQDHASGHKQDSWGSTKLGEDKNFGAREVESGRITQQEQIYEQRGDYARNHNQTNAASSGSSSDDQIDDKKLWYSKLPKFSSDMKSVKARTGPSGYLKVKGRPVENPAITAVKRQLGRHYREDGPPLSVEFDLLPPGAFEYTLQDPVDETYSNGEHDLPASADVPKVHQHPKFSKGYDYNSAVASHNPNIHGKRFITAKKSEVPFRYFGLNSSDINPLVYGAYYPRKNSSVEFPEGSIRDARGSESREDYGILSTNGFETVGVLSRHRDPHLHGENVRAERKPDYKNTYPAKNNPHGENAKNSCYAVRGYEHLKNLEPELHQHIVKTPKRTVDDSPHQHPKRASVVDNQSGNFQVTRRSAEMPSRNNEDDESAETDSSADCEKERRGVVKKRNVSQICP